MKAFKYILFGLLVSSTLTSCFREDEPVEPYKSPEGVKTAVAEMKPDYSMQVYYDLETNQFVKSNHREDWDFSYSCKAGVSAIYLNTGKRMCVFDTQSSDWNVPVNTNTTEWLFDESTGEPEKTALHGRVDGRIYLLNLGLSTAGTKIGFKKIRFVSNTEQSIDIEYADIDGNNIKAITLTKDADYNFVYYSVKNGGEQVFPEPKKNEYDLLFSYYTTKVYQTGSTTDFLWYAVTGVLINPTDVSVAIDSTDNFVGITYQDLNSFTFSNERDVIGYEWKRLNDINTGTYTVLTGNTYMIHDRSGSFWKLRFTSFTNELGYKGYPTFEVGKF
jgi:hypothetical protein